MNRNTVIACAILLSCTLALRVQRAPAQDLHLRSVTPAGDSGTQETPRHLLTLAECRERALRGNALLVSARLETEAARQAGREALTRYFPVIDAGALFLRADHDLFELESPGGNLPVYDGNPMNLPAATQFAYLPPSTVSMLHGVAMGFIDVVQPVYTGGRIVNGNRLAALGAEVRSLEERLATDEVLRRTEEQYWNVVVLREKITTLDGYDRLLAQLERQADDAVAAGLALKNDLLKVRLERSELRLRRAQAEHGRTLAMMALCQYAGIAWNPALVPADTLPPATDPHGFRADHAEALARRAEHALLAKSVEAAELQTRITRGALLPSAAVGITGRALWLDENDGRTFGAVFGTVSLPLSAWWGGTHAVERESLREDIARTRLHDGSALLLLQMEKAWLDLDDAWQQLRTGDTALAQAEEQLRVNTDSHARGLSTIADLLDAQAAWQRARDRLVEARAQFRVRLLAYLQCTGRE